MKGSHGADFAVYALSGASPEHAELRGLLAAGLREAGFSVVEKDETRGFHRRARRHVVVAPQDFFASGAGLSMASAPPRGLIAYLTDLPRTRAHRRAEACLGSCEAVWALEAETAAWAAGAGLAAAHVPPGWTARAGAREASWRSRPIGVFFQGELSARLSRFFARAAPVLAGFPCRLDFSGGADAGGARVVLALHRDQLRRSAWRAAVVHGFGRGALVVAEPGAVPAPFVAGRDFVEAPLEEIPAAAARMLEPAMAPRAARMAARGALTLRRSLRFSKILSAAAALASTPRKPRPAGGRVEVLFDGRPLRARTAAAGGAGGPAPAVTVGVTLKDYEGFVVEALDSAARQTERALDLIVVDDRSRDGSAAAAKRWLSRNGRRFRRFELLRCSAPAGLARARNATFERAETPWVFVLDADNRMFPRCVESLVSAARDGGADFAYGYLRRFGEEEALKNTAAWDPDFLRRGFSYDAMALVGRSAWSRAGGYRRGAVQGWEDYDFWLRLARAGGRGVLVPEIVAEYRVHMRSMSHVETEPGFWRVEEHFRREFGVRFEEARRADFELSAGRAGGPAAGVKSALRALAGLEPEPPEGLR